MSAERAIAAPRRVAIVGAGWAGLAAAVQAVDDGHAVSVFEMAGAPGGRAREVEQAGRALDNGQHILIGAYRDTLALMGRVGADPQALFDRRPLALVDAAGRGLRMPPGAPVPAFVRAVLALGHWPWRDRLRLLWAAQRWRRAGFAAPAHQSVAELIAPLPESARREIIEPLCVAALNTPAERASAAVLLRVLRDALFGEPGASDLLLPRVSLSALLPRPAVQWLQAHGAALHWRARVQALVRDDAGFMLDGQRFDAVVLACSAPEAARLAAPIAPRWSAEAGAFGYEPIVTVYLESAGSRWPDPMIALADGDEAPAQFAFDLGALDAPTGVVAFVAPAGPGARAAPAADDPSTPPSPRAGVFAFVASGARLWLDRGLDVTAQATLAQATRALPASAWRNPPRVLHASAERRATFECAPALARPAAAITPGLAAAGDYIEGPYPATLEGAVRSGLAAARIIAAG